MAAGADRTRLQGTILSGRSVVVSLGQGGYDGWYKAGYGAARDRKLVPGSRLDGIAVGMTAGLYKPDMLVLSFLKQTAQQIKEYLATLDPNGTSYGDAIFTTTIRESEPDTPNAPVILYTFAPCSVVNFKVDEENTADELKEDLSILFLKETTNGLSLFTSRT